MELLEREAHTLYGSSSKALEAIAGTERAEAAMKDHISLAEQLEAAAAKGTDEATRRKELEKKVVGGIKSEMAAAIDSLSKKRGQGGGAERTAAKEASGVMCLFHVAINCQYGVVQVFRAGAQAATQGTEATGVLCRS